MVRATRLTGNGPSQSFVYRELTGREPSMYVVCIAKTVHVISELYHSALTARRCAMFAS